MGLEILKLHLCFLFLRLASVSESYTSMLQSFTCYAPTKKNEKKTLDDWKGPLSQYIGAVYPSFCQLPKKQKKITWRIDRRNGGILGSSVEGECRRVYKVGRLSA